MDEVQHHFDDATDLGQRPCPDYRYKANDTSAGITDSRIASLLLVLTEINESVAGLDSLPEKELTELVAVAIEACGFSDPIEVRAVVATVLQAIEAPGAPRLYAF